MEGYRLPVLCVACVRVCYVDRRKGEEAYIPALPRRDGGRINGEDGMGGLYLLCNYTASYIHSLSLSRPRSLEITQDLRTSLGDVLLPIIWAH